MEFVYCNFSGVCQGFFRTMMNQRDKIGGVLVFAPLLVMIILAASSCNKDNDLYVPDVNTDTIPDTTARVVITVVKDSINFITLDTITVPAVQASVRFYLDIVGAEHIDTTILTNTNGKAEFVWFEDAIIQYDIVYGIFSSLENFVIIEQGETQEFTVNVSD